MCKEVSAIVVDQLHYLWDFVLTGETEWGLLLLCVCVYVCAQWVSAIAVDRPISLRFCAQR